MKFNDFHSFDEIKVFIDMACEKSKSAKSNCYFSMMQLSKSYLVEASECLIGHLAYDVSYCFDIISKKVVEKRNFLLGTSKRYVCDDDIKIRTSLFRQDSKYREFKIQYFICPYASDKENGKNNWVGPIDDFYNLEPEQREKIRDFILNFYNVVKLIKKI